MNDELERIWKEAVMVVDLGKAGKTSVRSVVLWGEI
jgi:hypothetical protein